MTKSEPKTVLQYIFEWSLQRPLWQRDALRRIISKGWLDDTDINELTELCKQGRATITTNIQLIPLDKSHLPANPDKVVSVSLLSINNVNGVNNLAAGQSLTFGHNGLTVIYGDNGAGKSGYARILKRVCRARHIDVIHPNIYDQEKNAQASATFNYSIEGVEQLPELWHDSGDLNSHFSTISVFDSNCAAIHINKENEIAFRPFGLDVPDKLASICQSVKDNLIFEQKQLEKARNPIFSTPVWKNDTAVGKKLASLDYKTDIQSISILGTLSDEENARLIRLKEDLSKNPATAAAEQRIKADNIKRLLDYIRLISEQASDDELCKIFHLAQDAKLKREAARIAADEAFSNEALKDVGGETWRILWDSARQYSTHIYPNQSFPSLKEDALCVLCQQSLSNEAHERMERFENFIKNDTECHAQEAEKLFNTTYKKFSEQKLDYQFLKPILQEIAIQRPDLVKQTYRFIASVRLRRCSLMTTLNNSTILHLPSMAENPTEPLIKLEKTIRDYVLEFNKAAAGEERKKLENDFAELSDRKVLHGMLSTVEDEINRLKNISFIKECLIDTTTNTITNLGNDIADSVITSRLRDTFQKEIVKLAAEKVRVEMVRSGGKFGSPQYQIRLFAKPDAKVGGILSEGEQTCVALAAFLTELATTKNRSAIIFDDPVSSLDHRWRKKVAKRLVEEAENRQVIVLTHDLVFVNDLNDLSKPHSVKSITISRGKAGTGIISDGLPWQGKSIEDRIDKLEKNCRKAKALYEDDHDVEYQQQAVTIYNNLRASWERAIEDVAFSRVVQRHRDYINTKDLKKASILSESDCDSFHAGFKKCCDIVDAHDPSSARNADVPTPDDILRDIQALKSWVITLKNRQKNVK